MLDRPLPLSYTSAPLFCPFTVSPFIIYCPNFTENPPIFICLVVWSLERGSQVLQVALNPLTLRLPPLKYWSSWQACYQMCHLPSP